MVGKLNGWALLAGALVLGALAVPGTALGHGDKGEHVASFQNHLDDYEADVAALASRLDELAARYRREGEADVAGFVQAWEDVRYHAAVEEVATPLYPAIWQAISGLRQAVKEGAAPETVRERADGVVAALREGLGGLKLKASMRRAGAEEGGAGSEEHIRGELERMQKGAGVEPDGGATDNGPGAAFERIRTHLDEAVAAYDAGDADKAKGLIRDAYFNDFEGLEGGLIEQDPALVTRLEEAFNAGLPGLINDGAATEAVRAKADSMQEALAEAEALLRESGEDRGEVF